MGALLLYRYNDYAIIIETILKEDKLATTVYDVEEIELQSGAKVKLKPLSIKQLRKFLEVIKKVQDAEDEAATLGILVEACGVALETQLPDLVADLDKLEDALDVPTINRILEVCGGIKMDDPNLIAAAVLAGQN